MSSRTHTGPSLPQSLLEELNGETGKQMSWNTRANTELNIELTGSAHKHKRKGGQRKLPRKEARKLERESRKQRKAEYFSAAHTAKLQTNGKRHADADHAESPQRKKLKVEAAPPASSRLAPSVLPQKETRKGDESKGKAKKAKAKTALEKLSEQSGAPKATKAKSKTLPAPTLRTPKDEEEDAYIAYLERKLGWTKGGKRTAKYGKGEEDDGLDGASLSIVLERVSHSEIPDLLRDLDSFDVMRDLGGGVSDQEDGEEEDESDEMSEDEDVDMDDESASQEDEDEEDEEWHGFGDTHDDEEEIAKPVDEAQADGSRQDSGPAVPAATPGMIPRVPALSNFS